MSPTPAQPPQRLTLKARETAELLSISERTLWSLTAPRGPIPCLRLNRSVLYSIASLERFIADAESNYESPLATTASMGQNCQHEYATQVPDDSIQRPDTGSDRGE